MSAGQILRHHSYSIYSGACTGPLLCFCDFVDNIFIICNEENKGMEGCEAAKWPNQSDYKWSTLFRRLVDVQSRTYFRAA